jgi:hypothetical protein
MYCRYPSGVGAEMYFVLFVCKSFFANIIKGERSTTKIKTKTKKRGKKRKKKL